MLNLAIQWICVAVIVGFLVYRAIRRHIKRRGGCGSCSAECPLRDVKRKRE